ncbi:MULTISPECIES: ParA family protein [unclassified Streptomyces]|uniref:ParA family protein n=1 Tax=unclassified Streptomyces TaxID=2593676 RepID=UPI00336A256B
MYSRYIPRVTLTHRVISPDSYWGLEHIPTSHHPGTTTPCPCSGISAIRLQQHPRIRPDTFDYTLIDCPPSLFHLTQLSMTAADHALVVTEPRYDSAEAATRVRDFITERAADPANPETEAPDALQAQA